MTSRPSTDETERIGAELYGFVEELYPICRSITGDGVRETLGRIGAHIPLAVHEVPTGTAVFDWTVPNEWNVRDAWVKDASGRRVVDFRRSNLHLVSYSAPVRARLPLEELKKHLFTLEEHPEWIPYRTSYYHEAWGFCLSHRQLRELPQGEYEVCVDATLAPGALTYGECVLPGSMAEEILLSCHVCHPSLCNDNLSAIAVATFLAARLAAQPSRRHTFRILFAPGTIGAITWLARNEERLDAIKHGLVLACLGDGGAFTYKKSRRGCAPVDRAALHVLQASGEPHEVQEFSPLGYDERQFCSPGIDLPVGCLMRTPHGRFPEYHTSADDLRLVRPAALAGSLQMLLAIVSLLERDVVYVNRSPKGEPQLGRRGLYRAIGGVDAPREEEALLWVLNLADGRHGLLDIAERSGLEFELIAGAARALAAHGLLTEIPPNSGRERGVS